MKRPPSCDRFFVGLLFVFMGCQLSASVTSATEPFVVFLVRHAEKVDASRDPELSAAGKQRAEQLADTLRDANVNYVHSTDYIRTRDTAAPIAKRLDLAVGLYDPRNLPALVKTLQDTGGRHLVVGHSTTTPQLAKLLGGRPGTDINEAGEYDRLYVVTSDANGGVSTVLIRYGKPFAE